MPRPGVPGSGRLDGRRLDGRRLASCGLAAMYGHGHQMNGHGRHHGGTTVRPRAAGFALRHLGRSAVTRCRLASWRRGSRYPSQRYDGSLPPLSGQACRPVRSGHGSLRLAHCDRTHCERLAETRRRLRSGRDRDTHRSPRCGCSGACCSTRPGCSDTRHSRSCGCSEVRCSRGPACPDTHRSRECGCSPRREGCSGHRCSRTPGWSSVSRRRRPCVSYRGCRHPRAPPDHGGPGPSWYPSPSRQRPMYGCHVRPVSWPAGGDRPRPRFGLPGGQLRQPRCADGPGPRRPTPAVPGHSCQRAWRPSKPSGSRYLLPGSSASRIPRPRSSTSSLNTTQTSEEGRSTTSGATLFKHVRRRPTLPRGPPRSTIGAEGLNFRVRNGTGCFPFAITAETLLRCHQQGLC